MRFILSFLFCSMIMQAFAFAVLPFDAEQVSSLNNADCQSAFHDLDHTKLAQSIMRLGEVEISGEKVVEFYKKRFDRRVTEVALGQFQGRDGYMMIKVKDPNLEGFPDPSMRRVYKVISQTVINSEDYRGEKLVNESWVVELVGIEAAGLQYKPAPTKPSPPTLYNFTVQRNELSHQILSIEGDIDRHLTFTALDFVSHKKSIR